VEQWLKSGGIQAKPASEPSVAKSASQPSVTALRLRPSQSALSERHRTYVGAAGISEESDERRRKKPSGLQAKLKVNPPGDIYEQEADRIAHSVLSKPAPSFVSEASPRIQRFADRASVRTNAAPASVSAALTGSGSPLNPALRQDMERRFGHDFSRVRVHTDTVAGQSADEVNALAYTVGRSIVFGAGRFAPETLEGRRLLAHELTHVVQQGPSASNSHPIAGRILHPSTGVLQRDRKDEGNDPWDNLDPSDRKEVEELYEALTRRHPFLREDLATTVTAITGGLMEDARTVRPDCPLELSILLSSALSARIEERPRDIDAFLAALEGVPMGS
jgi:hypothetical protein